MYYFLECGFEVGSDRASSFQKASLSAYPWGRPGSLSEASYRSEGPEQREEWVEKHERNASTALSSDAEIALIRSVSTVKRGPRAKCRRSSRETLFARFSSTNTTSIGPSLDQTLPTRVQLYITLVPQT